MRRGRKVKDGRGGLVVGNLVEGRRVGRRMARLGVVLRRVIG